MVIDGDGQAATDQAREEFGEPEEFVESAFEGGDLFGEMGAEPVPEGLVLGAGVEPFDGVVERRGAGRGPDEDAPEHAGGASGGVTERENVLEVVEGLSEHDGAGGGSGGAIRFHGRGLLPREIA